MSAYCEIGHHTLPGEAINCCAFCHRYVCEQHVGNPQALPGDYVSCPDCVMTVVVIQRKLDTERAKRRLLSREENTLDRLDVAILLLEELAKAEPDYCSCPGMFGYATCMFCQPEESHDGMVTHANGCLVLQARAYLNYTKGEQV